MNQGSLPHGFGVINTSEGDITSEISLYNGHLEGLSLIIAAIETKTRPVSATTDGSVKEGTNPSKMTQIGNELASLNDRLSSLIRWATIVCDNISI